MMLTRLVLRPRPATRERLAMMALRARALCLSSRLRWRAHCEAMLPQRLLGAASARALSALSPARPLPLRAQPLLQLAQTRAISSTSSGAPPEVGLLGLDNLAPNPGAHKPGRRIGRGRGGGRGKTSGRGHKGAGARKGKKIPYVGFAGGQTPLHRRIPKRGFTNTRFKREYAELNLETLAHFIRADRLQPSAEREIGLKELVDSGAVAISM